MSAAAFDASATLREAVSRSRDVHEVRIGRGILDGVARMASEHLGGPCALVADGNTWRVAGEAVEASLRNAGIEVSSHVLDAAPRPKPTVDLARQIGAALGEASPIAVGSGVINDVVRLAAFEAGRPFVSVATAASMDGYVSAGAPLSQDGFKKTIPARAPVALLADLDVIASAPPAMSGWGYGDLAGKVPAGGDWLVSEALGIEPRDDVAWPLVQDNLGSWLGDPKGVRGGEPLAVAALFEGLVLSGLAMEFHGSSRPASGADHQIAHMWEMEGLEHAGERVSHGACVSVGALVALRLFDWALGRDLSAIDREAVLAKAPTLDAKRAEIGESLPAALAERAEEETTAKHLGGDAHAARLDTLAREWPALRARLRDHLWRAPDLLNRLRDAGAPVTPGEIGVTAGHLRRTVRRARFIRSRYTILDLLDETGLLDAAIEEALSDEVLSPSPAGNGIGKRRAA